MMKLIKGIANYLTWWLTGILGGIILFLFLLCFICIVFPIYAILYIISLPLEYNFYSSIKGYDTWEDKIINYIQKYMGYKPF